VLNTAEDVLTDSPCPLCEGVLLVPDIVRTVPLGLAVKGNPLSNY